MDTSQVDKSFARLGQVLVVFAQTPVLAKPGEGALHNPSFRQDREADHARCAPHELHEEATHISQPQSPDVVHPCVPRSYVSTIGKDGQQPGQVPHRPLEELSCSISVLHSRRMHYHNQQQAHCVYKDVSLPAFDFLASIIPNRAPRPPFSASLRSVFTDWLSIMAALGSSSLPASMRTWRRNISLIRSNTLSSRHCEKYMYTTSHGGRS